MSRPEANRHDALTHGCMYPPDPGEKMATLGGQISGEHGIGLGKVKLLAEAVGPVNMALTQGIKKVFDPKGILNPGKVCRMI